MRDASVVGRVTLHKVSDMTAKERKAVVNWLTNMAKLVEDEGDNLAPRFTGRMHKSCSDAR